ncbi:MAG: MATE family efflux transporter [Sphaerochaetaceae bacterium]
MGVLFCILGLLFTTNFFRWFTTDADIVGMGRSYLLICTVFSLGIFVQISCERIMQGTGDTIHPMITQGTGAIINIILDPILIFGLFGFPKLGVAGAAIATVIGQWVAMIMAFGFLLSKTKELNLIFKRFRPNKIIIFEIYEVGLPSIIMQSIGSVMTVGMNTILISFTATAVAVFGVYFKLQSFIFMPVFGLVSAMISIVGYNYGAKNRHRITGTIKAGTIIAFIVMSAGMLVFQLFPRLLLSLFDASEEMMLIGSGALRRISLHFPIAAVAIMLSSSFQAMGKGTYSLLLSVVRQLGVLLPVAFLLSILFGLNAIWYTFIISEIVSVTMSIGLYRRIYRRQIRVLDSDLLLSQE